VKAIAVNTISALSSAGSRTLRHVISNGGDSVTGGALTVNSTVYRNQQTVFTTDGEGNPLSVPAVNAMQVGMTMGA